jgi:hypothetical protein
LDAAQASVDAPSAPATSSPAASNSEEVDAEELKAQNIFEMLGLMRLVMKKKTNFWMNLNLFCGMILWYMIWNCY